MHDLQALLFDVDGTLAETERDGHRLAFNAAFRDAGLDWRWSVERYGELLAVTGGKERIVHYIRSEHPALAARPDLESFVAGLHRKKTAIYTRLLVERQIPLRPGVGRLLREARLHGLRLAIATTTTPANVTGLLESCLPDGAVGWFEVIGAGDVVSAKKPAPDIYHYVLAELSLGPQDCLVFEDSANGLRAARAAGLKTVVTLSDYSRGLDLEGSLLVVDHLGEPTLPFTVLAGDAGDATYVDVSLLRRLHVEPDAPGARGA
jgi:beta-phosphoglucomutase-like phosphatase (HAD superfamily)